jgi:hypothetical protein
MDPLPTNGSHFGMSPEDVQAPERRVCDCGATMYREQFGWQCPAEECRNFRQDGGGDVFTPINDCEHKDKEDGCCSHPKNMTPECHVDACPRLHPILRK